MNKKTILSALLTLTAGTAMAQHLAAVNEVVDLGQIMFQMPVTTEFEVENKSRNPLSITNVRLSCGCTKVDYDKTPIQQGGRSLIKVTYDAKQMGHFDKLIGVYTTRDNEPLILHLRGAVVNEVVNYAGDYPYKLGDLRVDVDNIEFDDVNRGDRPYIKMHIMNPTSQTVQPVMMHLPNYLKADISPSKIAPGHGGEAIITLDSRQLRDFGLTQTSIYLGKYPGDKVAQSKELNVSAVLLPDFDELSRDKAISAPHIKLSTTDLDLGCFSGSSKKHGVIEIENVGQSELNIRNLQMFTAGLQVSLNKTHLAPGAKAKLKVTAIARDLKTARSQPRILMITNDPGHPKIVIRINVQQ